MIKKRYNLNWAFQAPEAVLTLSTLKCKKKKYLIFGGHDRNLYLMGEEINIIDEIAFDGWCRCCFTIDIDNDGCEEILAGAGDGSMLVLKFDEEEQRLVGLMHQKVDQKINCCTAGDISENGQMEIIFGGENQKLQIFQNIFAKKPTFVLYYDSWVTSCFIGLLKHPEFKKPFYGLLVGTKKGKLQLIRIIDGDLKIVWERDVSKSINDITIGDVTNDGKNEVVIATDDSYVKILSSTGERIRYIKIYEGRPLSLKIDDIDGDDANEIIIGCADGSLKIYHNQNINSKKLKLKWKTEVSTSIQDISTLRREETGLNHIIFGGYDRAIRDITDFEWGKKEKLKLPKRIEGPKIKPKDLSEYAPKEIEKGVPTNLEDYIQHIFEERNYIFDLSEIYEKLIFNGYSKNEIEEVIKELKEQEIIRHRSVEDNFWVFEAKEIHEKVEAPIKEEIEVKAKQPQKMQVEDVITEPGEEKELKPEVDVERELTPTREKKTIKSISQLIIDFIREKGLVRTQEELIEFITKNGFSEDVVKEEIDLLNAQGIIDYSSSSPRGWSLISKEPENLQEKLEKKEKRQESIRKKIFEYLEEHEPVSSKSDLITNVSEEKFDEDEVEFQIDTLNNENKITYSRSKPQGWRISK
ncbi:MAG: hypothetical protein BAJALOKI2v1_750005 [Promethearchaeota archaeon]|nr:MAG: hypothetical protein BAJALOKI2v1_750005 [Candidatus Lokiarchaeota archaeon]